MFETNQNSHDVHYGHFTATVPSRRPGRWRGGVYGRGRGSAQVRAERTTPGFRR